MHRAGDRRTTVRITRVYHSGPLSANTRVELEEASSRHLARVLRIGIGDPLVVFDGRGAEYPARVSEIGRRLTVELGERATVDKESPLALKLIQGIARGDHMDFAIRKATELGITGIVPVITARTQTRHNRAQLERRMRHWEGIIISACEQCARNTLPVLAHPQAFTDVISTPPAAGTSRFVLSPDGELTILELPRPSTGIELLVGPEGGLTGEELNLAMASGFRGMRLGPRVLRTETAAIGAIAILQALWGDL
jgi:16S rRNA (uracil1498-N3)-methyltransferase